MTHALGIHAIDICWVSPGRLKAAVIAKQLKDEELAAELFSE